MILFKKINNWVSQIFNFISLKKIKNRIFLKLLNIYLKHIFNIMKNKWNIPDITWIFDILNVKLKKIVKKWYYKKMKTLYF